MVVIQVPTPLTFRDIVEIRQKQLYEELCRRDTVGEEPSTQRITVGTPVIFPWQSQYLAPGLQDFPTHPSRALFSHTPWNPSTPVVEQVGVSTVPTTCTWQWGHQQLPELPVGKALPEDLRHTTREGVERRTRRTGKRIISSTAATSPAYHEEYYAAPVAAFQTDQPICNGLFFFVPDRYSIVLPSGTIDNHDAATGGYEKQIGYRPQATQQQNPLPTPPTQQQHLQRLPELQELSSDPLSADHSGIPRGTIGVYCEEGSTCGGNPTPLFERSVTEEEQELKAYVRIVENQRNRLTELARSQGDLDLRLQREAQARQKLEATLETREREWFRKLEELEKDRRHWKEIFQVERAKNARLVEQLMRKGQDIQRMLQRKYVHKGAKPAGSSRSRTPPREILVASGSVEEVRTRNANNLLLDFFGM